MSENLVKKHISIPQSMFDEVKELSRATSIPATIIIREAIAKHLKELKKND